MRKQTRALIALTAVVIVICAVGWAAWGADVFIAYNQTIEVTSDAHGYLYYYNYTTDQEEWYTGDGGDFTVSYRLPYGAWLGFFTYDSYYGQYTEVLYLYDEDWSGRR